jgi:hypothetical protein
MKLWLHHICHDPREMPLLPPRQPSGFSGRITPGLWFFVVSVVLVYALLRWGLNASSPPQMFPGSD